MLNQKELDVLTQLSKGVMYIDVAHNLGIHISRLYAICNKIREKTGLGTTKSATLCKEWLDANPNPVTAKPYPDLKPPTPKQRQAMELYAVHRMSFEKIAWTMGVTKQVAEYYLLIGMARARIQPRCSTSDRRAEIIAYLQPDPMNDPAF